jgi:anti-anti-sigma regulatory factor
MNSQLVDELVQTLRSISLEDRNAVLLQIQEDVTRAKIQARIEGYEQHYKMSTEQFYSRFLTGELGDDSDYMDWAGSYEMLQP